MKWISHALSIHWEFWQNLTVHVRRALINLIFSEASSVLTGSKITSGFALKTGLSSLWLLAGCWIQLQNGCMYFPDKSGIFPDIKTTQEFADFYFFFLCMWKGFYGFFGFFFLKSLSLFSWWSSENVLSPFWGYLCCFEGMMSVVLILHRPRGTEPVWAHFCALAVPPVCLSVAEPRKSL